MSDVIERLFKFPTVMVDLDNENHKRKLGLPGDEDIDMIIGESEYPWYDFNGIGDRWLPTAESFEKAKNKQFDACSVTFINIGTLLVPWPKAKFKKKLKEFIASLKIEPEKTVTIMLTDAQMKEIDSDGKE